MASVVAQGWERQKVRCADSDFVERNGFVSPVLKHGPRSLTYVRVQGWQTPVRNESNSGRTFLGHYPPVTILREKGLSVSINVETRKMMNYA